MLVGLSTFTRRLLLVLDYYRFIRRATGHRAPGTGSTEPDPFLCSTHPHTRTQNTKSKGPLEAPLRFARTKKVRGTGCPKVLTVLQPPATML
jgi:hypothetical protein